MRRHWTAAALAFAAMTAAVPAQACRQHAELDPADVRDADLIVVGRIADYRRVPRPSVRADDQEIPPTPPGMPPEVRRLIPGQAGHPADYARFTVLVDEVLAGEAGATFEATWNNPSSAEPESMASGPFLIALRRPASPRPSPGAPSVSAPPFPVPHLPTLLQEPCAPPFLLESGSEEADDVRRILNAPGPGGLSTPALMFLMVGAAGALLLVVTVLRRRRRSRG